MHLGLPTPEAIVNGFADGATYDKGSWGVPLLARCVATLDTVTSRFLP